MDKLHSPYAPPIHRMATPSQPGADAPPGATEAPAVAQGVARAATSAPPPPRCTTPEKLAAPTLRQRAAQAGTGDQVQGRQLPEGSRDGKVSINSRSLQEQITDLIAAGKYEGGTQILMRAALEPGSTPSRCAEWLAFLEKEQACAYYKQRQPEQLLWKSGSPSAAQLRAQYTAFVAGRSQAIKDAIAESGSPEDRVAKVVLLARVLKSGTHTRLCRTALLNSLPLKRQAAPGPLPLPPSRRAWSGVWTAPSHEPLVDLIRWMGGGSVAADLMSAWGLELYEQIWAEATTRGSEDAVKRYASVIFRDLLARSGDRQLIGWLIAPLQQAIRSDLMGARRDLDPHEREWIMQGLGYSDPRSRMYLWPALFAGRTAERFSAREIIQALGASSETSKTRPPDVWTDLAFAISMMAAYSTTDTRPVDLLIPAIKCLAPKPFLVAMKMRHIGATIAETCQLNALTWLRSPTTEAALRLRFAHMIGAHGRGHAAICKLITGVYASDLAAPEKQRLVTACLRGVGANLRAGDIAPIRQALCEALAADGAAARHPGALAHFYTSIGDILRSAVEHFAKASEPLAVGLLGLHFAEFSQATATECAWLEKQAETERSPALGVPAALAAARALDGELRDALAAKGPWPQWFNAEFGLEAMGAPAARG